MINTAFIALAVSFSTAFVLIEFAKRLFNWVPENSRKLAHVVTCLLICLLPYWLTVAQITLLGSSFIGLLFLTKVTKTFTSVQSVKRTTYGEFAITIAAVISAHIFLPENPSFFLVGFFVLAISDTTAEVVGRKWSLIELRIFNQRKSIGGSIVFAITAIIVSVFMAEFLELDYSLTKLCIGLVAVTLVELILVFGLDNIAIPVTSGLALDWATS